MITEHQDATELPTTERYTSMLDDKESAEDPFDYWRDLLASPDLSEEQRAALVQALEAAEEERAGEPSSEVYQALLGELLGAFEDCDVESLENRDARRVVAFGWWIAVNREARAVSSLCTLGLGHEAAPIARTLLEGAHAMALAAIATETQLTSLEWKTKWTLEKILTDALAGGDWDEDLAPYLEAHEQFRVEVEHDNDWPLQFDALLEKLGLRSEIYPLYRLLSLVSHGTLFHGINFLRLTGEPRVSKLPLFDASHLAVGWALRGLCLAAVSLESLSPGQLPYFARLSEIAHDLGVALPTGAEGG